MTRRNGILLGMLATVLFAELYHGALGGANRLETAIEERARRVLDAYELPQITAQLDEKPLQRRLILTGPADDFQHGELVRIMNEIPGVSSVRWTTAPSLSAEPVK